MNIKWKEKKMIYLQAKGLLLTRHSERRYAERRAIPLSVAKITLKLSNSFLHVTSLKIIYFFLVLFICIIYFYAL